MVLQRALFTGGFLMLLYACVAGRMFAQQEDDKKFDTRVDSIVQHVFESIDREVGTYIFTEEPPEQSFEEPPASWDNTDSTEARRDETGMSDQGHRYTYRSAGFPSPFKPNATFIYPWEHINDNFLFRYNRVEGLFLGLNDPKRYSWDRRHLELFGSGGYGFAEHRWRYSGGFAEQFGAGGRMFELGAEGHSLTDSDDQWLIGQSENTLASIVARDDYRNYFGREGFSVWTGFYRKPATFGYRFEIAYLGDSHTSLDRMTNWSVFGGEKMFRDNPAIDNGNMRSIVASIEMEQLRERRFFTTGWTASLSAEFSGGGLGGDFQFNRFLADVRRYQPLSTYDNFNLRLRAGSATGSTPRQKLLALGGISTMPAFSYKEFSGNRLLLANAEYIVNGKMFDDEDLFPSWLLRNVNIILFYDAGFTSTATASSPVRGFDQLDASTIRSDYGFGFGTRDAKLRLGFAWRTDIAEPVHVFLRLDRPF